MPFREKSAWASLAATVAVYSVYFTILLQRPPAGPSQMQPYLGLLFGCVVTLIVVQIILQSAIAIAMRGQAQLPPDERERLINLKSDRIAMGVLSASVACLWLSYIIVPAAVTGSGVPANLMLLTLVLSAAAKYASQIVYFHRAA